ncbi:hypothetical protein C2S53_018130 [Perilla frutescens var. hirtella]|uniref:No apical meristem-associated C-terminal domain-containing protein n=1 Tax=Perilla frutescens var. hirtella TaxID=608512 RepID=A0AAD4NYS1_PERFH|nr:hypothetical protein C2S53_018130 [Perilla frutescens var. hirtella]
MWSRVHKLYHETQAENPDELNPRNIKSMKGRWKRLCENAGKWVAALEEANWRKRSGMNQKDIEMEAHTIYKTNGSKFQDLVVYNDVMSKHSSTKRSRTFENGEYHIPSNPETPTTGGSTISRPTGRDKSKKKEKGKATQSGSEVAAELHALRLTRDNENELIAKKLELESQKP